MEIPKVTLNFPLLREANNRHRTFVIVVAWMLLVAGFFESLRMANQIFQTAWFFFSDGDVGYQVYSAIELMLCVAALVIGLRLLYQKETALNEAIIFLWLFVVWNIGAIALTAIETSRQIEMVETLHPGELNEWFGPAWANFSFALLTGILTISICAWIARRLSQPAIKSEYVESL